MTYAKNSTITAIHRPITNGMYNDTYTVIYSNGIRRNYTIKGAMNKKHFEFIQSATVESKYSKHTGKHTADIFTAPAEPKEEPTTEEQTAEEPTTTAEEPAEEPAEVQTAEVQTTEESKNYYAETYSFGFIAHNSEYGAPSLLIFSSKEDREKYINKYDIYRGDVNKRVIAITAKEARKYYERTRDGVRGWKDGTEYIKHIRDNIYYSVESGDYGRTSEEFTL